MKSGAVILAIYILMLAFQPVLNKLVRLTKSNTTCCADTCCASGENKKQTKDDQSDNNTCNPFQTCANCCCLYFTEHKIEKGINPYTKVLTSPVSTNLTSVYCTDCFHPPEIA